MPLHGEVVLSLVRLDQMGPVDDEAAQVTAGAGVTLQQVADADPGLDLGILIASRDSATVGGAVAANAGGLRVLRFGPMRAQLRGIEAVMADGTVVSHLAGLVKDNTGYDYPSLLAGSEGTLAVITQARLRLVPRLRDTVTALAGLSGLDELHALARRAVREVPGLVSAEFFTSTGLEVLLAHAGLAPPLPGPAPAYLLLEASGPGALDDLADVICDRQAAAALASGSHPGTSSVTLAAAGVTLAVLTPLAYAKRRLGRRMASRALRGDGALSGIGAATSLLALAALVLYDTLGWWWANRVAALIVAAAAAAEAWHTAPRRRSPS